MLGRKCTTKFVDVIRAWLEKNDAYTLHRTVRKLSAPNPYSVPNVMDVWKCDLSDVQAYAKYNDNHRYILSVIDVFSKFLHLISVKTKSVPSAPSCFDPYLMTQNIHGVPYVYGLLGAGINTFGTCYAKWV